MKIFLILCLVPCLPVQGGNTQNLNKKFVGLDYRTDPANKVYVNHFFSKAESLLNRRTNGKSGLRDKRLLASQDFTEGVEFIQEIIRKISEKLSNLDFSFFNFSNFFSQIDKRKMVVLESTSTVIVGMFYFFLKSFVPHDYREITPVNPQV